METTTYHGECYCGLCFQYIPGILASSTNDMNNYLCTPCSTKIELQDVSHEKTIQIINRINSKAKKRS